ncbi:MAG TPA: POTRA domain-containing protein [Bryobacteraceae bacterium]|nr:POTRA domain-containing protein [Bryobacteraceae bacterium]
MLFVLVAGMASGQARKAAPPPSRTFPIISLRVEGNRTFSAEQILGLAAVKVGQPADQSAFEAARDRLMASGFFETVGYKYAPSDDKTGYAASFQVLEVQQVYPVQFERLSKPPEAMKSVLRKADPLFSDKVPGTRQVLERYAKLLEPLAGEKVVGKVMPDGEGGLRIVFQPARVPPSVAEVRFVKNDVLPGQALQNAIAGAAIGSVWEETRFREILDANIRPLYEARGRLRVSFPKITTEPVQDVNGLRATVEVMEGDTFTLGGVKVLTEAASDTELLKAGNLNVDDLANFTQINAAVERMRAAVRRNGYLQAKSTVDRKLDDAAKKVFLTVRIDAGKRFVFSKLTIKGLDIISEPQIRKAWTLTPGQPFNPDYPEYFLARMREEGVFENLGKTRAEVKTDEAAGTAEVILHFSAEAPQPQKKPDRPSIPF